MARDVIRDAALAAAARAAAARRAPATADAEAAEEGDAGTGADETRGGAGGGAEPIPAFLRLKRTRPRRASCAVFARKRGRWLRSSRPCATPWTTFARKPPRGRRPPTRRW